jgi:hypothetical protein
MRRPNGKQSRDEQADRQAARPPQGDAAAPQTPEDIEREAGFPPGNANPAMGID